MDEHVICEVFLASGLLKPEFLLQIKLGALNPLGKWQEMDLDTQAFTLV